MNLMSKEALTKFQYDILDFDNPLVLRANEKSR